LERDFRKAKKKPLPPAPKPEKKQEKKQEKKPQAEPEKKPDEKPEPKPVEKEKKPELPPSAPVKPRGIKGPTKRSLPDASREIDRLRAVDRIRRLQALKSAVDARRAEPAPQENSSPVSGEADTGDRAHVYYGVVTHRVWEHWTYAGNPEPEWETLVFIRLESDGALLEEKIEASSGNEEFDRSVLRAIVKAAPFPPPPEGIDRQIVFRFRP